MKHLVAYSGGLASFEVARLCVRDFGAEHVECVFTDTMTEDEDLYRFLTDTIAHLGCKFTALKDGRDIWQVFNDVRFMGNSRIDPCSKHLKREMFRKYLKDMDPTDTTLYYGIGAHEAHRLVSLAERWAPFKVEAPLIALETTKEHILHTLEQLGLEPPRLYDLGFEHNNCGGFCVKGGQRHQLHLLKTLPDRYAYHEAEQEKLFAKIGPFGFIKKTTNGVTRYLSLKEFREMIEAGEKPEMYQDGACACFS